MRVVFWGTRGSVPTSLGAADVKRKIVAALVSAAGRTLDTPEKAQAFVEGELDFAVSHTFGGNTSCVQIDVGHPEYLLCDVGSGARVFGNRMLATHGPARPQVYNVFMSHLHWDHVQGFPFFVPVYIPGNHIRIHGCHPSLEEAFRRQHADPGFPVYFSQLAARVEFVYLDPGRTYEVAGVRVTAMKQVHGGDSFGYRFEHDGKVVVYSTDSEHKGSDPEETRRFVEFFRDADLVIFDAMYALADTMSVKEDWGHSSNIVGVELCQMAGARRLALYHHEPIHDDATLARILAETRRLEEITRAEHKLEVSAAFDGMELVI
jgi:phosphoribosyl 1,2-cyclic phosphodiesterase